MRPSSLCAALYKAGNLWLVITTSHLHKAKFSTLFLAIRRADRRIMLALVSKPTNLFALFLRLRVRLWFESPNCAFRLFRILKVGIFLKTTRQPQARPAPSKARDSHSFEVNGWGAACALAFSFDFWSAVENWQGRVSRSSFGKVSHRKETSRLTISHRQSKISPAAPNGRRLCALSPHFVAWNEPPTNSHPSKENLPPQFLFAPLRSQRPGRTLAFAFFGNQWPGGLRFGIFF